MTKFRCVVCGYVYEEDEGDMGQGIQPGTGFEDLPEEWLCPVCGVDKHQFEAE